MKLQIKPFDKNNFPLRGLLIKHFSPLAWVKEIQILGLSLDRSTIYPIPDTVPNALWGCFIQSQSVLEAKALRNHQACQMIIPHLFIPEKTTVYPKLTEDELERIFPLTKHVLHPDFGLVELTQPLDLLSLIHIPEAKQVLITPPKKRGFIPKEIKSFKIAPIPPEETLKHLEEQVFPEKEKLKDQPLNIIEKGKLGLYKLLFDSMGSPQASIEQGTTEKTGLAKALDRIMNTLSPKASKNQDFTDPLQQDFEDLQERNRKAVDRLMDMLKNNPEEGLKYAILLDDEGTSRGEMTNRFELSKRWFNFSLFSGATGSTGSGSVDLSDHYNTLHNQYHQTAKELIAKNEHHKAAFIYLKLLKNHILAAETLANGNHFAEAASIYLKKDHKKKAAECYEKGNMIENAIALYKELQEHEKVGDLYLQLNDKKTADVHYKIVAKDYNSKNQYLKASQIWRHKIQNENVAQNLLLVGWNEGNDAFNCLNNYFANINDEVVLGEAIERVYENDVTPKNNEVFLKVLQYEYGKKNKHTLRVREIAYEIIAQQHKVNPTIVSELRTFNPKDKNLVKDTIRFKISKK